MEEQNDQDFETTTIERERWTSKVLTALQEMRRASADGLYRHGCLTSNDVQDVGASRSIPPAVHEPVR